MQVALNRPTKRRIANTTLFGVWSPVIALMASSIDPLPDRQRIINSLKQALDEMKESESPDLESWRNLSDGMNLIQSLSELGWIEDKDGAINDVKASLIDAFNHHKNHGRLHMRPESLESAKTFVINAADLLNEMSARMYWSAVRRTEKRIAAIRAGVKQRGDIIVSL